MPIKKIGKMVFKNFSGVLFAAKLSGLTDVKFLDTKYFTF